jgi:hypothetical protein
MLLALSTIWRFSRNKEQHSRDFHLVSIADHGSAHFMGSAICYQYCTRDQDVNIHDGC